MTVQWYLLILHYWIEYCHHYFCVACSGRNWIMLYHAKFYFSLRNICKNCLKCYKSSYFYSNTCYTIVCICIYMYMHVYMYVYVYVNKPFLTQAIAIKFFTHSAFTDHLLLSIWQSMIGFYCMWWERCKRPWSDIQCSHKYHAKEYGHCPLRNRKFWLCHMATKFLRIIFFLSFFVSHARVLTIMGLSWRHIQNLTQFATVTVTIQIQATISSYLDHSVGFLLLPVPTYFYSPHWSQRFPEKISIKSQYFFFPNPFNDFPSHTRTEHKVLTVVHRLYWLGDSLVEWLTSWL